MPPRKKTVVASTGEDGEAAGAEGGASGGGSGIDQFELPKATIARIAKNAIPSEIKMQKEVPLALMKGSTVFISYLAALSHDLASEKNQKTISALHVLEASKQLGWDDGGELHKALKKELKAFRAISEAKKQGQPLPPKKRSTVPTHNTHSSSTTTKTTKKVNAAKGKGKEKKKEVNDGEEEENGESVEMGEEEGGEEQGRETVLRDDRPNVDEETRYGGEDDEEDIEMRGDEEDEEDEGIEVYQEEGEEEDDVLSEAGSEGVEEPVGGVNSVDLDDVESD